MKKINTKQLFIGTVLFLFLTIVSTEGVFGWDDCPKGLVNDEYPGSCSLYVDTDGNGICDHSEPAPEDREVGGTDESFLAPKDEEKGGAPKEIIAPVLAITIPLILIIGYVSFRTILAKKK